MAFQDQTHSSISCKSWSVMNMLQRGLLWYRFTEKSAKCIQYALKVIGHNKTHKESRKCVIPIVCVKLGKGM